MCVSSSSTIIVDVKVTQTSHQRAVIKCTMSQVTCVACDRGTPEIGCQTAGASAEVNKTNASLVRARPSKQGP